MQFFLSFKMMEENSHQANLWMAWFFRALFYNFLMIFENN